MKPFYLDENSMIRFPKREIYSTSTHEVWFKDEGIPTIGVIRGYFHNNHISVFINDYDIPPIHPAVIMDWFNTYSNLNYVELGANRVKDSHSPKLVIFRGDSVKFHISDEKEDNKELLENEDKNLIDESEKIDSKEKIGFKNEDNSNK